MASSSALYLSKNFVDRMSMEQIYDLQQHIEKRMASRAAAAAAKSFAIPEVLENILIYLPFTDLFVVVRVDRTFRDLVASSLPLYRSLFITYQPHLELAHGKTPTTNPFLHRVLEDLDFTLIDNIFEDMVLYLRFYRDDLKEPQDLNQLFDCAKEGTWRLTKITNFPVVTRIRFTGGEKPMDIGLEGQEATLGTLWDLALRVRKRSITI